MSNLDQVLQIEPSVPSAELVFRGPFNKVSTAYLKLTNPSDKQVCFRVRTTAPKRYSVRPNNGVIESKGTVTVAVMLQPFDYDPNVKFLHKFMVQTMFAPDGKIENQEQLWKDVPPEQLMDSKLKCVFDPTGNSAPTVGNGDSQKPQDEEIRRLKEQINALKEDNSNIKKRQDEEIRRLKEQIDDLKEENSNIKTLTSAFRQLDTDQDGLVTITFEHFLSLVFSLKLKS
ncbi:vesicle-associated membrane protein/synaptobrevin-binding protein-like [Mercenaria mercenaria]|uniref:vesicle-associated membrane protein/synaptobrevin-binding protein-like n=1 Tax=Mercenaria mercenaria TaxID=6596 RepID=UPI00234E6D9C|nr:vesicle-associated membrane protein/synaptobrevin-binding protein-like [Mercenaria mercenaria]